MAHSNISRHNFLFFCESKNKRKEELKRIPRLIEFTLPGFFKAGPSFCGLRKTDEASFFSFAYIVRSSLPSLRNRKNRKKILLGRTSHVMDLRLPCAPISVFYSKMHDSSTLVPYLTFVRFEKSWANDGFSSFVWKEAFYYSYRINLSKTLTTGCLLISSSFFVGLV